MLIPDKILKFIEKNVEEYENIFNPLPAGGAAGWQDLPEGRIPLVFADMKNPEPHIVEAFNRYAMIGQRFIILVPARVNEAFWIKFVQPMSLMDDACLYFFGRMKMKENIDSKAKKAKDGIAMITVGFDLMQQGVVDLAHEAD